MSMLPTQLKNNRFVTNFFFVTTAYYVGEIIGLKLAIFRATLQMEQHQKKI